MSEGNMRGKVVRELKKLHAIAVENPALPGTPDVNYIEGWIELKWLREWPVRPRTIVPFKHFTPQQRIWQIQRRLAGGRSWVLVQCKREWLLFDGGRAALYFGTVTKFQLYDLAKFRWESGLKREELILCISQKPSDFYLSDDAEVKLKKLLQNDTIFPLDDI